MPRESDQSRVVGFCGGQMDGVKALAVLASIYYPGDGIVAKDNYQTSSGERYDQSAPKCAALLWPLGTMLHLVHGRNNIDVTINDHGPYHKGRGLDCTPAVDKGLHLGGLGSVRVEAYPPLPKARPAEVEVATWSGTDPKDGPVKPPAGYHADKSLRPLPSNDGPQRFNQPNRMAAARHRAHTSSVVLGNSSPSYASGLFILPTW
jgi:rare lipoprotein A (peptidoglycan hydrolase)